MKNLLKIVIFLLGIALFGAIVSSLVRQEAKKITTEATTPTQWQKDSTIIAQSNDPKDTMWIFGISDGKKSSFFAAEVWRTGFNVSLHVDDGKYWIYGDVRDSAKIEGTEYKAKALMFPRFTNFGSFADLRQLQATFIENGIRKVLFAAPYREGLVQFYRDMKAIEESFEYKSGNTNVEHAKAFLERGVYPCALYYKDAKGETTRLQWDGEQVQEYFYNTQTYKFGEKILMNFLECRCDSVTLAPGSVTDLTPKMALDAALEKKN